MSEDIRTPAVPGLDYAFSINVALGEPVFCGPGRNGERRVFPIAGGTVSGPLLNGKVMAGGADYALVRNDRCTCVTAHYMLQANDGTPIYIQNKGLFVAPEATIDRIDRGEILEPDQYYFRAAPVFDAPEGPHVWLSDRLFISTCIFRQADVIIDVFVVR
jgi:hypothetical protein